MRIVAIIQLKKNITGISIFCIIIGKFNYQKEFYSVILLKVNKDLEVNFCGAVLPLGLTVCLRVKCGRELLLDA